MTAYLRRSSLSAGGLSLSLKNELGQPQDAEYVVWTVTSAHNGKRMSGIRMKAVRRGVGQYYAPWYADDPTGAYEVSWEYKKDHGFPVEKVVERFFVTDLDDPTCKCGHVRGLPPPGGHVFEPGARMLDHAMTLRLVGANGVPRDGYRVVWRIECPNGRELTPWRTATRLSTGLYGLDQVVQWQGGLYFVRWQWSESLDAPFESLVDPFQIVDPKSPKQGVVSVGL